MISKQNGSISFLWIIVMVLAATGGLIYLLVRFGGSISTNSDGSAVLSRPVDSSDWSKGNPEATTVLVEYGDFQCPACEKFYPIVEEIFNRNKDKMKFVFRHFPIRQIHQNADLAAQASEAAGMQGKFWEMYDLLYKNQSSWATNPKAKDVFVGYATSLGLDLVRFSKDLDSSVIKDKINTSIDDGFKSKVQGTPTFFLNGSLMKYTNLLDFEKLIGQSINGIK